MITWPTEYVEGAARITEARLGRDPTIIDFRRRRSGYELYRADAISSPDSKVLHGYNYYRSSRYHNYDGYFSNELPKVYLR